jgi:hypothetical protein
MAVAAGDAAFGASLAASAVVLAVGLVSEPRDILAAEAWAPLRHPAIAAGVYLISAWMIGWTVIETLDATLAGTVLIGLAALAGLLVVRLRPLSMSLAHLLLLLFALLFWTAHDGELGAVARHALAWAAIALPFALAPLMRAGSGVVRLVPRAGTTAAWLLALTAYPNEVIAAGWLPAYWTALAMALVAYRRVARAPHAGWLAAFSIGLATAAGCALPLIDPASSLAIVLGTALPAACWITAERLADRQQRPSPRPATAVLRAVAPWLATLLLTVLPLCFDTIVEDYLPVAWGLVGFALFAVALATARRTYRYAGLTVLALALAKLAGVVVMADIDVILKVFAAIGLGLVLLIVGYIYFRAVFRGSSHTPSDSRHEE